MIKIDTMALGDYQTNCYIVRDALSKSCAVIDPGYEPDMILAFLHKEGLTLDAILLTHGHFDHVGAVRALVRATGCKVWMREGDYSQFRNPTNLYFYPLANCEDLEINLCEDGEAISAGGLTFHVMETPGHTWGSVCYLCQDAMFSGDTLFQDCCGRTDLETGSLDDILRSLKRLAELPGNYRVFPGHEGFSSLDYERSYNPYIREAMRR